jgi:hypothetical protein
MPLGGVPDPDPARGRHDRHSGRSGVEPVVGMLYRLGNAGGFDVFLLLAATAVAVARYFWRHPEGGRRHQAAGAGGGRGRLGGDGVPGRHQLRHTKVITRRPSHGRPAPRAGDKHRSEIGHARVPTNCGTSRAVLLTVRDMPEQWS